MSGAAVPAPGGDPQALMSAAAQLGSLATAHADQMRTFQGHAKTALSGWNSTVAEQYAVAAGQAGGRFTAVSTALKAAQNALNTYAHALESAQRSVGLVNAQLSRLNGDPSSGHRSHSPAELAPLFRQRNDALSALNQAARSCASALGQARSDLAVACPDTLTAQQLVAAVEAASKKITSSQNVQYFEAFLSGYALYVDAASGVGGAQAGQALRESEAIADSLGKEHLAPEVQKLLEHVKDPNPLLTQWQQLTMQAEKEHNAAQAAALAKGANFWEGLRMGGQINVAKAGAHAATQTFLDELARTSKFDLILAPVGIALGIHDVLYPGNGPGWERTGNRIAGGASIFGGAAALASWALGLEAVTWEVPGLDVVTTITAAVLLTGSALWALGDLIYNERHTIAGWADKALHWVEHYPQEFGNAIRRLADPTYG